MLQGTLVNWRNMLQEKFVTWRNVPHCTEVTWRKMLLRTLGELVLSVLEVQSKKKKKGVV